MAHVYKCDRCRKVRSNVGTLVLKDAPWKDPVYIDLCNICVKKLKDWLKGKEV